MNFSNYTKKTNEEVLAQLGSSEKGIFEKEVKKRLEAYGFNEIKVKEIGLWDIFLRQFKSPFFYLLFIASLIAFLAGERIDALVILFFVLINVFLGFFQEAKAHRATVFLKKYLPVKIRVIREGQEKTIDKRMLVPGDIVLLEAGNIVPADLRILKYQNLLVDESVLTGESVPVAKVSIPLRRPVKEVFKAKNILFAGTSILSGEAEAVVVATAKDTVFGDISKLISGINKESTFQKDIFKFSRIILKMVVITIVFIFLANLIIKGTTNFFDFLIFCIALIVSIIPEALPLVVTFALSKGALNLVKKKVIVRRLSAIEDLGNIEILCTDKTGTLTENKLELEKIFSSQPEKCLLSGLLTSPFIKEEIESVLNPFDTALFFKASKKLKKSLKTFQVIQEMPFDPERLRNSTLLQDKKGDKVLIVRGAPETILKLCSGLRAADRRTLEEEIKEQGRLGKRVLAVAAKDFSKDNFTEKDEKNLIFLGYFSFRDPLKKTTKEVISSAQRLGIAIKILTGDSPEVAGAVAKEVGLIEDAKDVILGKDLEALPEKKFEKACQEFSVFARISPKTKYRIIKSLQKEHEVGFLGEGVNDTPSLKAANVAIAVQSAADVSREVSDIVLLKKDLKAIINGIREGRTIFSNINKYIKSTLSSNFGNFYSISLIALFIPFLPMLPVQILLVNLLSDFPLVAVASDKVDIEELKKPKLYQLHRFIWLIVLLAVISTIFDLIFFSIFRHVQPANLQTLWFIESILTEIVLIYAIRTSHLFYKAKPPSLGLALISVLTLTITIMLPFSLLGQETFHFISPAFPQLFIVISLVLVYFLVSEIAKLLYFRQ